MPTPDNLGTWLLVAAYRKLYKESEHKYWSCDCLACQYVAWAHRTLPAYWSNAWTNPARSN